MIKSVSGVTATVIAWVFASSPARAQPGDTHHYIVGGPADPFNATVVGSVALTIIVLRTCRKALARVFGQWQPDRKTGGRVCWSAVLTSWIGSGHHE